MTTPAYGGSLGHSHRVDVANNTFDVMGKRVITVGAPTAQTDAATKEYVDAANLGGNPMSAAGDMVIGGAAGVLARLAANDTATKKFLSETSSTVAWGQFGYPDVPSQYVSAAGAKNALTATLSPAITAYVTGMLIAVTSTVATNDAASTINLNAIGAKPIVTKANAALSGGEIVLNTTYLMVYDGTSFRLLV